MAKVYISGKITGDDNYIDKFADAACELNNMGFDDNIINPATVNLMLPISTTWEEYMNMSITMLDMCDTIYMLKDWKESKGACLEYGYALAKDKTVMFQ